MSAVLLGPARAVQINLLRRNPAFSPVVSGRESGIFSRPWLRFAGLCPDDAETQSIGAALTGLELGLQMQR
jgi:hypothetical protein